MAYEPKLIVQVPSGGALERQLEAADGLRSRDVALDIGPTDPQGNLEAAAAGEVVLSLPSPEALVRQADDVRRVVKAAGAGAEPLVIVVEAAEELREEELASALHAAEDAPRPVILRVIRQV